MKTEMESAILCDDIDQDFYENALDEGTVGWDIETSGLDWSSDHIGTCQLATEHRVVIVKLHTGRPEMLRTLLADERILKVFHHAAFDLRFMVFQWNASVRRVACTKIASKVLDPHLAHGEHSLKPVLLRHLGIDISKSAQRSDWLATDLTEEQLTYAANDVVHLPTLLQVLTRKCLNAGVEDLVEGSFEYLPDRVMLDLRGSGDVFAY
jgi:ribonuclease D